MAPPKICCVTRSFAELVRSLVCATEQHPIAAASWWQMFYTVHGEGDLAPGVWLLSAWSSTISLILDYPCAVVMSSRGDQVFFIVLGRSNASLAHCTSIKARHYRFLLLGRWALLKDAAFLYTLHKE